LARSCQNTSSTGNWRGIQTHFEKKILLLWQKHWHKRSNPIKSFIRSSNLKTNSFYFEILFKVFHLIKCRDAIINGSHPISEEEAIKFAAIQCQVKFGDYNEAVHRSGCLK
jgi:hypothetical protein